jgi:cell division protein FtsB
LQVGGAMSGLMQNIEENTLDIAELYKRLLTLEQENKELKDNLKSLNKK